MNSFEEDRLSRVNDMQRERQILLSHKFQANIQEFAEITGLHESLTDEIIQSQIRITSLAKSALEFNEVKPHENIRANFVVLRKAEFRILTDLTRHKNLAGILSQMVGEFLILERCLNSLGIQSAKLRELRSKLAPNGVENFVLGSGEQITILPNHSRDTDLPYEIIALNQDQSIRDLAEGTKVPHIS